MNVNSALSIIFIILLGPGAFAGPIRIGVMDTGFGYQGHGHGAKLCKQGHKDFTGISGFDISYDTETPVPLDVHSHGTNIVGIIDKQLENSGIDYCVVILKIYQDQGNHFSFNYIEPGRATVKAIQYATQLKLDYVNYSAGGEQYSKPEAEVVTTYLNGGGKFIAAAGNEHKDLDNKLLGYYPALDDARVIIVGNKRADGKPSALSNYGEIIDRWEFGEDVTGYDITLTGTSQATAIATGKIILEDNANKETQCHCQRSSPKLKNSRFMPTKTLKKDLLKPFPGAEDVKHRQSTISLA